MLAGPFRYLSLALLLAGCASQPVAPVTPAAAAPSGSADGSGSPAGTAPAGAPVAVPPGDAKNLVDVAEEIVIDMPAERILPVFEQPDSYWHILPMVKSVKYKGKTEDGVLLVELEQGIAFVTGSYTASIRKVDANTLDLSIDHRFPSVLRDGKGTVELKPEGNGKTRVFFKATADLGESWALHFIKDRIRSALRKPPSLLKKYVEPQAN
jgi:carbon monoxide dehydrogenase subunit G